METETKKNIRLISSNTDAKGNRVEATEETKNAYSMAGQRSKELIETAAELHKPTEHAEYLGSATVHFWKRDILANSQDLFTVCHVHMDKVSDEQHASLGWKELGDKMMRSFGRKPPKQTITSAFFGVTTMKPGRFPNISNRQYHEGPGLSSSALKKLFLSGAHYKASLRNPRSKLGKWFWEVWFTL